MVFLLRPLITVYESIYYTDLYKVIKAKSEFSSSANHNSSVDLCFVSVFIKLVTDGCKYII